MLSSAPWLTAHRARVYGRLLAGAMAGFVLWALGLTVAHSIANPGGLPFGADFDAFWAAAHLAAGGHPASAYDNRLIEATERAATIIPPGYLAFYYPPTFLLLLLPLGWLGYSAAFAVFLAAGMALVLVPLRRILPQGWAWLPLLGFPGFLMNGLSGQNAAFSASCFAASALWLERRPLLAGAALGGLAYKPQLAVCVPVALLAARRWRALLACAASAGGLALLSWWVLGSAPWRGFLANTPNARADIETIAIKWPKMQSLYGAVRLAGGSNAFAYAAQTVLCAATVALLVWIARRRPGPWLETAALTASCLLFTPFLYDYDLAVLAVPLACLLALAQRGAWLGWEKLLLAVLFVYPLLARPGGLLLGVNLGPLLIGLLLLVVARRAARLRADVGAAANGETCAAMTRAP